MMATTMLETARDRVASRLAEDQGTEASAFAPELLTLVAEAVLLVLERCLDGRPEADVAERMRQPGLIERLVVRRCVRELLSETYGPSGFRRHGGAELAEAILMSSREASGEERVALLQELSNQ